MLKGRGGDEIPFRQRTRSRERKLPPRRGAGAAVRYGKGWGSRTRKPCSGWIQAAERISAALK